MTALVHVAIVAGAFAAGYTVASIRWRRIFDRHLRGLRSIGIRS